MKKITLCGSTKFKREFEVINKQLSMEGNVIYSVAFFGHADNIPLSEDQKTLLDKVHFAKIDNSDGIFVIDVNGYIGESTRNEINHAENTGKFVKYLSSYPDLMTICDYATIPESEERPTFDKALERLLNSYSMENGSNTPDFILRDYMKKSLEVFNETVNAREIFYSKPTPTH